MGQASVCDIVKQHRGWIAISSKAGKGTRFDVYLPATDEDPFDSGSPAIGSSPSSSAARETILLVEALYFGSLAAELRARLDNATAGPVTEEVACRVFRAV